MEIASSFLLETMSDPLRYMGLSPSALPEGLDPTKSLLEGLPTLLADAQTLQEYCEAYPVPPDEKVNELFAVLYRLLCLLDLHTQNETESKPERSLQLNAGV
ncbi:MAG: hypothetical protein ACE5FA_13375, partial [Dehalococcoidia bacterium]